MTEVEVGELHDASMEVLAGVRAGDRVAGQGAILLKPLIEPALRQREILRGERS